MLILEAFQVIKDKYGQVGERKRKKPIKTDRLLFLSIKNYICNIREL